MDSKFDVNPDVFEATAERLERDGWIQGQSYNGERSCLVGALSREMSKSCHWIDAINVMHTDPYWEAIKVVEAMILKHDISFVDDESGIPLVPQWNDRPGRTVYQVIDMLKLCAKEAHEDVA